VTSVCLSVPSLTARFKAVLILEARLFLHVSTILEFPYLVNATSLALKVVGKLSS
jgi:hypothetical protein